MIRKMNKRWFGLVTAITVAEVALVSLAMGQSSNAERRVPVTISGGYQTDRRDGGRPVVLIAAALGVSTDTFRRAFSRVTPARGREPEPEQVHRNKEGLLSVLEPYGITNDRLDEVSDYYRYNAQKGELCRNRPASAYAIVAGRTIIGFKITDPGEGYSSAPTVTIPGFEQTPLSVSLKFTRELDSNGSIRSINLVTAKKAKD